MFFDFVVSMIINDSLHYLLIRRAKNKNDLSIYSENIQDSLNELEEKMKEKLESIVVLHENNIIETENMKKNVYGN